MKLKQMLNENYQSVEDLGGNKISLKDKLMNRKKNFSNYSSSNIGNATSSNVIGAINQNATLNKTGSFFK